MSDLVKVRPLVWDERNPGHYWLADQFGMAYSVSSSRNGDGTYRAEASPRWSSERETWHDNNAEACFDWCNAHNAARIKAAIDTTEADALRGEVDILLNALHDVIGMLDDPTGREHVRDMRGATVIARRAISRIAAARAQAPDAERGE